MQRPGVRTQTLRDRLKDVDASVERRAERMRLDAADMNHSPAIVTRVLQLERKCNTLPELLLGLLVMTQLRYMADAAV